MMISGLEREKRCEKCGKAFNTRYDSQDFCRTCEKILPNDLRHHDYWHERYVELVKSLCKSEEAQNKMLEGFE